MSDVAARAGVSHQTVSRVLNNPELVRPETRARVEKAIAALGYRRNMSARALRTRRTGLIGVVSPGDALFGPTRVTIAIEEAAREAGYATVLTVVRGSDAATAEQVMSFFLGHHVEGIIVIAPIAEMARTAQRMVGQLPMVLVGAGPEPGVAVQSVRVDQRQGAREAARHLIDLGHRRMVHLAGPAEWFDARERGAGWREELLAAGLEPRLVDVAGWGAADGHAATQRLLAEAEPPTAIFAANDYVALGAVRACQEAGWTVPGEVSVAGFDDVDAAGFFGPALTTVRQPFTELGDQAIRALLQAFGELPGASVTVAPSLVLRSSTSSPAA
ncbi:LacI family DNA-binding transcriptional regulator [Bogoriella caseilytica]|nr:LacI family DNA-binding transcriptional regulator [Bogoriella caseilytica]